MSTSSVAVFGQAAIATAQTKLASQEKLDPALLTCLRRLRRRAVPPNWSAREWRLEIRQIAALAALQAAAAGTVPSETDLASFVLKRADATVCATWRREWAFGSRSRCFMPDECVDRGSWLSEEDSNVIVSEPTVDPRESYHELYDAISKLAEPLRQVIVFVRGRLAKHPQRHSKQAEDCAMPLDGPRRRRV